MGNDLKIYRLPHGEIFVNKGTVPEVIYEDNQPVRLNPGQAKFIGRFEGLDIQSYFMNPEFWDAKIKVDALLKDKGEVNVLMNAGKVDKFGDQIMLTLVPLAYKETYAERANIDILVPKGFESIWENNPCVRTVFTIAPDLKKYDTVFAVNNLEMKFKKEDNQSCFDKILEMNKLFLVNKTPVIFLTDKEKEKAKETLKRQKRPLVGIGTVSAVKSRTYPHMAAVARLLEEEGFFCGGLDGITNGKFKYTFREMAAIINECDVIIAPDSAIFHLAAALKKRVVGIFGHTDGKIYSEDYEKTLYVQGRCPDAEAACWWTLPCIEGKSYQEKSDKRTPVCLQNIKPEDIVKKVKEQIERPKKILAGMLTYDLLGMTKKAISSIRTFHDVDLFVVDNESTDGTQEWLKAKGINFVSKRTSVAGAQNICFQQFLQGNYDYFLLLNNDVVLQRQTIDQLMSDMAATGAWAMMSTAVSNSPPWLIDSSSPEIVGIEDIIDIPAGSYSCTLFTREAIEKTGFCNERFTPRYIEDNDYTLRMRLAGGKFMKSNTAIYYHVLGAVVKTKGSEKDSQREDWERNIAIYKEIWGILPHESQDLDKLGMEWKRKAGVAEIKKTIAEKGKVHIVIERAMGGYGDILFATVLARELKKKFHDKVVIQYCVPQEFMPVLEGNPNIDSVTIFPSTYAADFRINLTDLEFRKELQEMGEHGEIRSARTEIYLNSVGLKGSYKPDYFPTLEELSAAEEAWKRRTTGLKVAVVPKGSNPMKIWPHMEKLCGKLDKDGYEIMRLDGEDTTFRQAAAFVATADLCISTDTGISNLAGTLGIPVLTIFANRNGNNFKKMFDSMVVVQGHCPFQEDKEYCDFFAPCLGAGPYRAKENIHTPGCLENLTFDEVYGKFKDMEKILTKERIR